MIRTVILILACIGFAEIVNVSVTPETKKEVLRASRSVLSFINRNSKVTDEYLRCQELNPKQPEFCNKKLKKDAAEANGIKFTTTVKGDGHGN